MDRIIDFTLIMYDTPSVHYNDDNEWAVSVFDKVKKCVASEEEMSMLQNKYHNKIFNKMEKLMLDYDFLRFSNILSTLNL